MRVKGWKNLLVAVIDIGTNTTRLLVAEVEGDRVRTRLERRHFISLGAQGPRPMAELIGREVAVARRAGVPDPMVVGTAALRRSPELRRLGRACERAGIGPLRVLGENEEAELAFLGATAGQPQELPQSVAVIDVGGGSTEIVAGAPGRPPDWWASRPVGSQNLTERALLSDPPSADQLAAARNAATRRLAGIETPPCEIALVAGGSSLRRLSGGTLGRQGIAGAPRPPARRPQRAGRRAARPRTPAGATPARGAGRARGDLRAGPGAASDRPGRSSRRAGDLAGPRSGPNRQRAAMNDAIPAPDAEGPPEKAPREAIAEAKVKAPTRGNRRLESFLEAVNDDQQVRAWWYMAQVHAERRGMSDHSWVHVQIVLNIALRLLRLLARADVQPAMVADHAMTVRDAEVVVAGGALLHDVGMSIHRTDHEAYSLFLAREALERLLGDVYKEPQRTIVIAEILHSIIGHRRRGEPYTLEGGVVRVADALDMAQGRSRMPLEAGQEGIHSISAAAVDEVRISAGEERPVRIEIELNNSAGIFQVDDLLATKIRGTPLEGRLEVVAEIEGESEKRLLSAFRLPG